MRRLDPSSPKPAASPMAASAWAALAVAVAAHVWLGLSFIRSAAPTFDEPVHLASGYSYWVTGRYRLNITDHPPLAEMWAAVPLLAMRPRLSQSHPDWIRMRRYDYSDHFLYRNSVPAERLMNAARAFSFLTLSALLLAALGLWAHRLGGAAAAVGSCAAAAFCPVLVSNLALVTTDGASAVLFFLVFWLLSREARPRRLWAAAGACAGLALASKFNMILIGPVAAGMLCLDHLLRRGKGRPRFPWGGAALAAGCAALALAAVYRVTQLPLFWEGLSDTLGRLGEGRASYLMGEYSGTGFWLYFPVALAVKTPLPTLALAAGTGLWWLKGRRRERLWVVLPAFAYFLAAQTAKVQIGVRHLLPMMPFVALLAGCGAGRLWELGARWRAPVVLLGVWLAGSVLRVHPHQLAYFNEAAGGPERGHRWLVDSNLDWGQDLKTLARAVRELGDPPIYLAFFGSGDPAAYGLRYVPVLYNWSNPLSRAGDPVDPAAAGRVLLAVSATALEAAYIPERDIFGWLKEREPLEVLGHSIFLYDLTDDRDGRGRLAEVLRKSDHPRYPGLSKSLLLH
ncbi:MAG: glycosyltransferase family 39 protein [Elusimicrobiota bacterium]